MHRSLRPVTCLICSGSRTSLTSETILVLGMHRSGTSALARTLNLLGLAMSHDLLAANEFNEAGYWEARQIVRFNDDLLAAFHRSWGDPKPMPPGWQASGKAASSVAQATALLQAAFAGEARVVVKDPRMSRVFPVWRKALAGRGDSRPACFICCRNPLEVYHSLAVRDRLSLEHALRLWLTYLLEAEYYTRGLPRAVIQYEALLEDWPRTLNSALAAVDLSALASTDARAGEVDKFINREHRHHILAAADVRAHADVPALVKETYALLLRDPRLEDRAEFDRLRQRWQRDWEATSPGIAASSFAQEIAEWHLEKSERFEKEEKFDDALAACDSAIALRPDLAKSHHRKGSVLLKAGRLEEAEKAQRQAIALDDSSPWIRLGLGAVLERLGRTRKAIEALEQAVERAPEIPSLHYRKGVLLAKAGRLEEAEAAQRRAIALKDSSPWFHEALAGVLERMRRNTEAIEALQRAIERGPEIARLHYRKGVLLAKAGRLEEAETAHRQAITRDDRPHWFHEGLANVLERMHRDDEAIEALGRAAERAPDIARLRHRRGVLLARAGRFEEAETAQRRAIALDDRSRWFHDSLAAVLASMGRTDEAIEALECAVERDPENSRLRYREGVLLAKAGRLEEAEAALERAAAVDRKSWASDEGVLAATATAGNAAATRDLSRILAGTSAQYWAVDIEKMLREDAGQACEGPGWPLGRRIPERITPPLDTPARSGAMPLLSVMIPVYNVHDENWLRKCIESVLHQDRGPQWAEIVIVDDASGNDIAQKMAGQYGDRIDYRRNGENLGLVANHNHCIDISRGQFVHFLHQDDYVEPDFYARLIEPLLRDESLVAVYANYRYLDGHGATSSWQALARTTPGLLRNCLGTLAQRQMIEFSSIVVRRSTYVAVGGFSPSLIYAFDWDMWGRVARLGPIWYEPACLANTRAHQHSATHRIGPLDRLTDEMRCVFHIVAALPPEMRRLTARVAFTHLMPKYWSMLISPPEGLAAGERDRLADFLMRDSEDMKDDMVFAAQLRRLRGT